MRGDFCAILLAKSLPYAEERPEGQQAAPQVTERKSSKKCLKHFFDTLRGPRALFFYLLFCVYHVIINFTPKGEARIPCMNGGESP